MIEQSYSVFFFSGFFISGYRTNSTDEKGGVGMVDIQSDEYKLGQNIRKYRLAKNWTQMDLSRAIDMDRADISKYENGMKGEMGFKTLKKFAQAFDVTTDQLLNDKDEVLEISRTYNLLSDENKKMAETMMQGLLILQQKQSA